MTDSSDDDGGLLGDAVDEVMAPVANEAGELLRPDLGPSHEEILARLRKSFERPDPGSDTL